VADYITKIPRKFILESGDIVTLKITDVEEKLAKDVIFRLWVPDVEAIYKYLIEKQGFEHVILAIPKGERYSLRKALNDVWELHLRLYNDGFIDAEVEVRREYFEHFNKRLNVVYEPFEFYEGLYDKLYVFYTPAREWIVKILDNFHIKLRKPNTLTPWKPIVMDIGMISAGLLICVLTKLTREDKE